MASKKGIVEVVKLLLSHGASVNETNDHGDSPLMFASENGHIDVVALLLSHGANGNYKRSDDGCSSLMLASEMGHVEIVALLLSHGVNVNDMVTDDVGWSSLMLASHEGHVEVVALLLSHGANGNDMSNTGFTAVSVSANYDITNTLRKWPITMAILIMQELNVYYHTDASTLIDLFQYLGEPDDSQQVSDEEDA